MALSLDGLSGAGGIGGNPAVISLTTTGAGLIYLMSVTGAGTDITGITDAAGNTWAKRSFSPTLGSLRVEAWWAYSSAAFSGNISVTYGSTATPRLGVFGISGIANPSSPFDPSGSFPARTVNANMTSVSNTISTNNADCFLIGLYRNDSGGIGTITRPSGFSLITTTGSAAQDISYRVVSAVQTSQVFTYSWANAVSNNAMFVMDAVYGPSSKIWCPLSGPLEQGGFVV